MLKKLEPFTTPTLQQLQQMISTSDSPASAAIIFGMTWNYCVENMNGDTPDNGSTPEKKDAPKIKGNPDELAPDERLVFSKGAWLVKKVKSKSKKAS